MARRQLTDTVFMIRPSHFSFNEETYGSNSFQSKPELSAIEIRETAKKEFDQMVDILRFNKINVIVFDELGTEELPDAVFPNNWISTHQDGMIVTYPMQSELRRKERREDIIDSLSSAFEVSRRYSLELFETQDQFLEGTGSLILDRENEIAYACLSPRTDVRLLHKFGLLTSYKMIFFHASDENGNAIYHTNVMMALGQDFVICCMEAVEKEKHTELMMSFQQTKKELLDISLKQMNSFAGNMLELINTEGKRILVMSQTAFDSLNPEQLVFLNNRTNLLPVSIPTIEKIGGGSTRCMIAEVFLNKKS